MSFNFNWSFFDIEDLKTRCQDALTESIAQTRRPPVISAPIRAVNIDFGTKPPELAFKSIPAVSLRRTHIVFALKYKGDASLTLETAVQANPLKDPIGDPEFPEFVKPSIVGALDALVLPFRLTLQHIELDTLVDVVYTPHGVVVNFHDEPLKRIESLSSLDMIPGVNEMISSVLKSQLTASFYEDIPESVWTSSSPSKIPPDPYFGARRWSQHNKVFFKIVSLFTHPFGSSVKFSFSPFNTLALNIDAPDLVSPRAILSRACLCASLRSIPSSQDPSESLRLRAQQQFLKEPSIRSSHSSSTYNRGTPKRRVISLKKLSEKMFPKKEIPNSTPSSPAIREDTIPKTPLLQSTECALSEIDTDEDNETVSSLNISGPTWSQRRFSTPEDSDLSRSLRLPKHRSTSMQPSKTLSLTSTPKQLYSLLRSPNRIPSTNDLIRNS